MQDRDEDFEFFEATENSVDLDLTGESFADLVIAPADWTIGTLYSVIGKQIDLDPAFQRRNVWSLSAKSRFIESLFLGIPIPQILLSSRAGQKNSFLVLDGKQRLLTIKEFIEGNYGDKKVFRLKDLRVLKELEGKTWKDIEGDTLWASRLLNETQRTAVIRNWESEKILYEIFYRLNSGSVKLSPMELRMSLHPGSFLKYVISWTEKIGPLHKLLSKTVPDPRMNDVELAVRFLGFSSQEIQYHGDLKKFLDDTCVRLNDEFDADPVKYEVVGRQLEEMSEAIDAGFSIFGSGNFCRKMIDGEYETRFNRAVFDVQVGALSNVLLRRRAIKEPEKFVKAYIAASKDENFLRAIESTTKTVTATSDRFGIFYTCLKQELGVDLDMPNIALPT